MNLTKATCLRKSKATTRRKFPPAISNLTRSRFNTFDFGAALCTSSVEVQCAALTSLCQRSSVTLASGCSLQKATSVFRATTLISLVNMFPKWEQVLVKLEGPFRPRTRRGTAANAIENASAAEADEACIYFSAKRRSANRSGADSLWTPGRGTPPSATPAGIAIPAAAAPCTPMPAQTAALAHLDQLIGRLRDIGR